MLLEAATLVTFVLLAQTLPLQMEKTAQALQDHVQKVTTAHHPRKLHSYAQREHMPIRHILQIAWNASFAPMANTVTPGAWKNHLDYVHLDTTASEDQSQPHPLRMMTQEEYAQEATTAMRVALILLDVKQAHTILILEETCVSHV